MSVFWGEYTCLCNKFSWVQHPSWQAGWPAWK